MFERGRLYSDNFDTLGLDYITFLGWSDDLIRIKEGFMWSQLCVASMFGRSYQK